MHDILLYGKILAIARKTLGTLCCVLPRVLVCTLVACPSAIPAGRRHCTGVCRKIAIKKSFACGMEFPSDSFHFSPCPMGCRSVRTVAWLVVLKTNKKSVHIKSLASFTQTFGESTFAPRWAMVMVEKDTYAIPTRDNTVWLVSTTSYHFALALSVLRILVLWNKDWVPRWTGAVAL